MATLALSFESQDFVSLQGVTPMNNIALSYFW